MTPCCRLRSGPLVGAPAADLKGIAEPQSRLITAGMLLGRSTATPEVVAAAVDTARIQRRIDLVAS
jgi:hypothetical protein